MKSANERKQDERARMRALGFVLRQVWIHPKDYARFTKYVSALNKKRKSK